MANTEFATFNDIPMSPLMNSSEFSRDELIHYFAMCGLSTNSIEKILTGKYGYSITKRHIGRIRAMSAKSQKNRLLRKYVILFRYKQYINYILRN